MAENSGISWTDHTFNPWIGCTNVSPGCDHCYAEALATRRLGVPWGPGQPRRRTAPANWNKVLKWQREADDFKAAHGRYPRVFAASLADIFDNEVDREWREDFFALVRSTPDLQWLIVTKRIGNVEKMLPADWGTGYKNVVLIVTVVNQEEADRDIPKLLGTPAWRRGLSIEPMLGPVSIARYLWPVHAHWPSQYRSPVEAIVAGDEVKYKPQGLVAADRTFVDWVITGGESAQLKGKRGLVDLQTQWVRDIAIECARSETPHHFKQWGNTIPTEQINRSWPNPVDLTQHRQIWREDRKTGIDMGRTLDGIEHNGFPE